MFHVVTSHSHVAGTLSTGCTIPVICSTGACVGTDSTCCGIQTTGETPPNDG
ncbi:hypothetical protein M0R04_08045 [Candidatus Dojkabacteria bacterium]|nr:hypothetical protein [Candidatus Dojkabacteria bacterium]